MDSIMDFTDLRRELEEVKNILANMRYHNDSESTEDKKLEIKKVDGSQYKNHGKYLGTTTRIYQRDIDNEKKLLEQHMDIEKEMKIRKLESDIRMEILFTKLELKKKGLI